MKSFQNIFSKRNKIKKKKISKQKIIIDYREKNSFVFSYLEKLGFETEFKELKIGDYIVKDVVIERKTVSDFVGSMINQRLLKQIQELQQYKNRLLIIEGISEQELYIDNERGVNGNAIRGLLLSILLKYKIPIIFTKNSEDTAKFILVLSKKKEKELPLNVKKKTLNKKERLQFIIEGFPGLGPKTARKLLERFKTIKNIINAPFEELKNVIGKKAEIFNLIYESY